MSRRQNRLLEIGTRVGRLVGWTAVALLGVALLILLPISTLFVLILVLGQSSYATSILVIVALALLAILYFGMIRAMEVRDLASWRSTDPDELFEIDEGRK